MTSFWFRSSLGGTTFTDYSFKSSTKDNIFIDFGIESSFDNGSFFDFSFTGIFLNRNGDMSLISSFEKTKNGDLSFLSKYKKNVSSTDMSIFSSFNYNIYTDFSRIMYVYRWANIDFDMSSSFGRAAYRGMELKNMVRKKIFIDHDMSSGFGKSSLIDIISYGFGSSFITINENERPIRIDADGFLWNQEFYITVSGGIISGITFNLGNIRLEFDNNLSGVMVNTGRIKVTVLKNLLDLYQYSGEIRVLSKKNFNSLYSGDIEVSYELGALEDFKSAVIELSIWRDVYDYEYNLGDHLSIDILSKKLDIRKFESDISIPFANVLNHIENSHFYNYISVPQKDDSVKNSVLINGFLLPFYIDLTVSKFIVTNYVNNGINPYVDIDNNLLIEDFKNIIIMTPKGITVAKNISNNSILMNCIKITTKTYSDTFIDTFTYSSVDKYFNENSYMVTFLDQVTDANSHPFLVSIYGINLLDIIIADSTECSWNGRSLVSEAMNDTVDIFMSSEEGESDGIISMSTVDTIDTSDIIQGFGRIIYTEIIDTTQDVYTNLKLSIEINGYFTVLSGVSFNIKPVVYFPDYLFDITFIDSFSYTDKINLDMILSEDSRLTANLFFMGNDFMSYDIEMAVTNYD